MIYTQDNFLPQDEFIALKDRCERRFIAKDGWGTEPVRVTHHDAKGDWNEGCNFSDVWNAISITSTTGQFGFNI